MGFFDSLTRGFKGRLEQKRRDQEMMEQLQKEAEIQRRLAFQEQFKIDAEKVAKAKAMRESAEKSGLQALRQLNRARRLGENNVEPGSFFSKMKDYTQKNLAKREENLQRTAMMRDAAEKLKESRRLAQKR